MLITFCGGKTLASSNSWIVPGAAAGSHSKVLMPDELDTELIADDEAMLLDEATDDDELVPPEPVAVEPPLPASPPPPQANSMALTIAVR
jgi:hypothetical protein